MRILALGSTRGVGSARAAGMGHAGLVPGASLTTSQRASAESAMAALTDYETEVDAKINAISDMLLAAARHDVPRELLDAWDAEIIAHIDTLFTLQNAELQPVDVELSSGQFVVARDGALTHFGKLEALDRALDEMRVDIEQRVGPSITSRNWKVALFALGGTAIVGVGLWWLYSRKPRSRS